MTYPDPELAAFFNREVVPLRLAFDDQPLAERMHLRFTPYFLLLDAQERLHRRELGFLPPGELIPWTLLGLTAAAMYDRDWDQAQRLGQRVLDQYPSSFAAPEAVFLRGINRFLASQDRRHLKELLEVLTERYPRSIWTLKAQPWAKLK
ncbi:MAG: hypothetical protein AB1814_19365 [Thermodesulfobacteriota bacterium]